MAENKKEIYIPLVENRTKTRAALVYNSELEPLRIPEYGRTLQQMVKILKKIDDREARREFADTIIYMMARKTKHVKDLEEFKHKLWDHLFILADFDLDIDSPFPKPTPETVHPKPPKLPYPRKRKKYRFYGNVIHSLIDKAVACEDPELKKELIDAIANHMKKNYLNWNKDNVDDEVIFNHLYELSEGKIDLRAGGLELLKKDELVRKKYYNKRKNNHRK